ncbi:Hypothetical predicted protein [Mytilus galloprovincialis]|uniref:Uncharacterized protein n=1 Tax=Mytilus galloprovincialis TaxID=29158 RepID=A0A8B6HIP9_MYTGA|nr:Hypothetical predicted protein [Mytilus galloprovincialis]
MASLNLANVVKGLMELYDRDDIQYSLRRCNDALDKLTNVGYTQHLIKKLQNYMGVLQYTLLRKENETGEYSSSSDSRTKYSEYMALSASGDLTHNTLRIATCYLDDELPVLPKPVAVELCIDRNQTYVSFHPFLYGLLLEYLWHEKYGSGNREKESLLAKIEEFVSMDSMIPAKQKSVGLNFMAYCYSLQRDYQLAYGCLARSLRLNPIRKNVAYCYMKYKIEQRRQLLSDS